MPPLTAPPAAPQISDPATFPARSDAWVAYIESTLVPELNLLAVLADASTRSVQSSFDDITAERLLEVGSFGLGATSPNIVVLDSAVVPGTYAFEATDPSAPGNGTGVVIVSRRTAARVVQQATVDGAVFFRHSADTGANWDEWMQVSAAAGSNGDGDFVTMGGGVKVCWHDLTSLATGPEVWTYPTTFINQPFVSVQARSAGSPILGQIDARGSATAQFSAWNPSTSARVTANCSLMAIGI